MMRKLRTALGLGSGRRTRGRMRDIRDWLDVLLATSGTGVVVGAVVALLAELIGNPSTIVVGVRAGIATGVATFWS